MTDQEPVQETITCIGCGQSVSYKPQIAPYKTQCKRCGSEITFPPLPPFHPSHQTTSNLSQLNRLASEAKRHLKKKKISTILAFCMLGCTLLLPVSMGGMFILSSMTAARQNSGSSDDIDIGFGNSITTGPGGGFEYKSARQKQAEQTGQALGIFLSSLCCPMIPYVLIMLALGTGYFAFRSSGN